MDVIVNARADNTAARDYFDLYVAIRQSLREGKMEVSDAEAYLAYKELLLIKKVKQLAQEMITHIKE